METKGEASTGSGSVRKHVATVLHDLETDVELVPEALRDWWTEYLHGQRPRYLETAELLKQSGLQGSMLELGGAPGNLMILLKSLGYDVRGVDIDPSRFQRVLEKHGVSMDRSDVEAEPLPFPEDTFDVVLCLEVIEHLRINPLYALREAFRVTKPGGHIFLSTPNITPVHRLLFLLGTDYQDDPVREFSKLERVGHMGHLRLYSLAEVRRFLEFVGFEGCRHVCRGRFRGGWKGRLLMLLDRDKDRWREFLFVVARKP